MDFGLNHWFLKDAIYKLLIDKKEYFGIENIKLNRGRQLEKEEIDIRYSLCNLVTTYIEGVINRTDIMAVLYKIDFIIVKEGKLDYAIQYKEMKREEDAEEYKQRVFEENMKMAEEQGLI